jgi:hypothetical protein
LLLEADRIAAGQSSMPYQGAAPLPPLTS